MCSSVKLRFRSSTSVGSGEGECLYWRATGQLPVTISDLPIDPGRYDTMREGIALQRRPATLAVEAIRSHRGLLMRIYEDQVSVVACAYVAPLTYPKELGGSVCHLLDHQFR